jgi:hypothetical protein
VDTYLVRVAIGPVDTAIVVGVVSVSVVDTPESTVTIVLLCTTDVRGTVEVEISTFEN